MLPSEKAGLILKDEACLLCVFLWRLGRVGLACENGGTFNSYLSRG